MNSRLLACGIVAVLAAACGTGAATTTSDAPPAATTPATVLPAPTSTPPETTAPGTTSSPSSTRPPPPESTTTTAAPGNTITIRYEGGQAFVDGSPEVARGDEVRIVITSDVADEAHLHGYDLFADLEPGVPATIAFVADRQGIYELELENARLPLLELEVR